MMLKNVCSIFREPNYIFIAVGVTLFVFTFAVWLPNTQLITIIILSDTASSLDKAYFLLSLYGSISTNFTVISALYTIAIAVLFGINFALFVHYTHRVKIKVKDAQKSSVIGITGLLSGYFGIGCATCGTFILTSILALFGASSILAYLPYGGEEFGLLGVGLLLYSSYSLTINEENRCVLQK